MRDGAVDRAALRHAVLGKPEALTRLEAILHPMVGSRSVPSSRAPGGRRSCGRARHPAALETGGDRRVDRIVVVSAPRAVQMHRIRARRRMSDTDIAAVIARQMPDAEKRRRADVVIRTGLSRHASQKALSRLIREVLQ